MRPVSMEQQSLNFLAPPEEAQARPKSSTERVRAHRLAKKEKGGCELFGFLGKQAALALTVLLAGKSYKSKIAAIEDILIAEARRVASQAGAAEEMVAAGTLAPDVARQWLDELAATAATPAKKTRAPKRKAESLRINNKKSTHRRESHRGSSWSGQH